MTLMKKMNFSRHVPVKALVPGSRLAVHIPGTGMAWVEASEYAAAIVRIVHKTLDQKTLQTPAETADNEKVGNDGWVLDESGYISKPLSPDAPQQPQEARTEAQGAGGAECALAGSAIAWGGKALRECLSKFVLTAKDFVYGACVCENSSGFVVRELPDIRLKDTPRFHIFWNGQVGRWETAAHPGPQRKINSDGSTEELED